MKFFITIIICSLFSACALPGKSESAYEKSTQLENKIRSELKNTWKEIESSGADFAILNQKTNSIFTINSACRKYDNNSLNNLVSSILSGIQSIEIQDRKLLTYQERDAVELTAAGNVDGVKTFLKILTVQKNNCIYDFTLIANSEKNLKIDSVDFNDFLKRITIR